MAARLYDRGGVVETSHGRDANVWTTVAREDSEEWDDGVQRRQRNRETVVVQGDFEELDGEGIDIFPRPS